MSMTPEGQRLMEARRESYAAGREEACEQVLDTLGIDYDHAHLEGTLATVAALKAENDRLRAELATVRAATWTEAIRIVETVPASPAALWTLQRLDVVNALRAASGAPPAPPETPAAPVVASERRTRLLTEPVPLAMHAPPAATTQAEPSQFAGGFRQLGDLGETIRPLTTQAAACPECGGEVIKQRVVVPVERSHLYDAKRLPLVPTCAKCGEQWLDAAACAAYDAAACGSGRGGA